MSVKIRRLEATDDRSMFRSGNIEIDRYFSRYAGQNQFRHHLGVTYVAVHDTRGILGFVTVTPSELSSESISTHTQRRLPSYPVPVLRVARLAVDVTAQNEGIGRVLLRMVFGLAKTLSVDVGCAGIVVDAKPEAVAFYTRLGFESFETFSGELGDRPVPTLMFVPLSDIP